MKVVCFIGLLALAALATAAPAPKAQRREHLALGAADVIADIDNTVATATATAVEDIFDALEAEFVSGDVKDGIVDFLTDFREVVERKIVEAEPIENAVLDEVKVAIDELTAEAKANADAGIEMGKDQLAELEMGKDQLVEHLPKIMAKIVKREDELAGYNSFEDIENKIIGIEIAIGLEHNFHKALDVSMRLFARILFPILQKLFPCTHGESKDYICMHSINHYSAIDVIIAVQNHIVGILTGTEKISIETLQLLIKLQNVLEAEIVGANPIIKTALKMVKVGVDKLVAMLTTVYAEVKINPGKGLLPKLVFLPIKDMLAAIKAKVASGEVKTGLIDILVQLREAVLAKIAEAQPIIKAVLDEVKVAIDELTTEAKADAEAGIEMGNDQLAKLFPKIMAKMAERQSNLAGYNIFEDKKSIATGIAIGLKPYLHIPDIFEFLRVTRVIKALKEWLQTLQHLG